MSSGSVPTLLMQRDVFVVSSDCVDAVVYLHNTVQTFAYIKIHSSRTDPSLATFVFDCLRKIIKILLRFY
jgi:hypothetical protein